MENKIIGVSMRKVSNLIQLLEDKGYIKVKINNQWSKKTIKCEQPSVTNKIKEAIENNVDERDYFYHCSGNIIYIFNTRDFIEQFDKDVMKQKITKYFDWYDLGFSTTYRTVERILKQYGYVFDHPHNSYYCKCVNQKKLEEKVKKDKERKEEIDNFIANLEL